MSVSSLDTSLSMMFDQSLIGPVMLTYSLTSYSQIEDYAVFMEELKATFFPFLFHMMPTKSITPFTDEDHEDISELMNWQCLWWETDEGF